MITRATWPDGISVVFRSLSWGEFRKVQSLQGSPAEKALEVYKCCLVEGPTVERIPAGIMMWVYQTEMTQSPFAGSFQALSVPLQEIRNTVTNNYLLCAQAMIASVFKIPFTEMDTWDSDTFFTRLAQAEFVSGVPLNPVDPSVPVDKKGRPMKKLKKQLTTAQALAIDKKYGAGSADRFNADTIRDGGEKPSRQVDIDKETFSYQKDSK